MLDNSNFKSDDIQYILFKKQLSKFLMCAHRDECILVM